MGQQIVYTESDLGSMTSKSQSSQNHSSGNAGLIQATTSSQLPHGVHLIQTVPVTNQNSLN